MQPAWAPGLTSPTWPACASRSPSENSHRVRSSHHRRRAQRFVLDTATSHWGGGIDDTGLITGSAEVTGVLLGESQVCAPRGGISCSTLAPGSAPHPHAVQGNFHKPGERSRPPSPPSGTSGPLARQGACLPLLLPFPRHWGIRWMTPRGARARDHPVIRSPVARTDLPTGSTHPRPCLGSGTHRGAPREDCHRILSPTVLHPFLVSMHETDLA